jgi:uncharacterized Fe-S cluster-containing radical SAM superfamily protein
MVSLDTMGLLRINRMVRSNRLKFLYVLLADLLGWRHTVVRFDPASACNLRCAMCYFSNDQWYAAHAGPRFTEAEVSRIAELFFGEALQLYIGCAREPTMYKAYPDIVRLAKEAGVPFVSLVTNAQLLDDRSIAALIGYGLDEITVSVHGITPESYHRFMPNARFDRLHRNLALLTSHRRESSQHRPKLRINYTANRENLDELADFFQVFGDYDVQCLQVRPMTDIGGIVGADRDISTCLPRYKAVIEGLGRDCASRGVTLLANTDDPLNRKANARAVVYENAVLRLIAPGQVWKDGFDPASMDCRSFKARIGYRRQLLSWILRGSKRLEYGTPLASSAILGSD